MVHAAGIGPGRTRPPLYKGWSWGHFQGFVVKNEAYKRSLAPCKTLERISKPTVGKLKDVRI
jgi:hypothetical protein